MNAHFIDINSIVTINSKVWIVSRKEPNKPILRIPKSEFNLIRKGVYRNQNLRFKMTGVDYWLSNELLNNIKVKCKTNNIDIGDISFSMQEFMNSEIIDKDDFTIHIENILHMKNTKDDVYLICSKNTKESYEFIFEKLEKELEKIGVSIKLKYFISETFYNRDKDSIRLNKIKVLIQHLIGYNIDFDKFSDVVTTLYDNIYFYEDDGKTVDDAKNINKNIKSLIDNTTDEEIKDNIKSVIRNNEPNLIIKHITFNKVNKFIRYEVPITWQNIIKTFEGFRYKKRD
jgi:hypothetical protein